MYVFKIQLNLLCGVILFLLTNNEGEEYITICDYKVAKDKKHVFPLSLLRVFLSP